MGPSREDGGLGATEVTQLGRMLSGGVSHHLGGFLYQQCDIGSRVIIEEN